MNNQMRILRDVGMQADLFREKTENLGQIAAGAFSGQKAQMKNLENIANSALKVSDVLDYIKRQTGRSNPNEKWKKDQFGEKLLKEVKDTLGKRRDIICRDLGIASEEQRLHVYLLLIREFIKQLVIFYEYSTGR